MPLNIRWIIGWLILIGVFFPFAVYVLLVGLPIVHLMPLTSPDAQTIGFVILATASLTILLTSMTVIFQQLGLSNSKQALGLPEGSVRALIALFLLTMFVIVTVHLFEYIAQVGVVKLAGLSAADKDKLTNVLLVTQGADGKFDVWIRAQNDAAERFIQQVFTAILTLVTAVSAFYFGARGASSSHTVNGGASASGTSPAPTDGASASSTSPPQTDAAPAPGPNPPPTGGGLAKAKSLVERF